jgi:hypothetical protein
VLNESFADIFGGCGNDAVNTCGPILIGVVPVLNESFADIF